MWDTKYANMRHHDCKRAFLGFLEQQILKIRTIFHIPTAINFLPGHSNIDTLSLKFIAVLSNISFNSDSSIIESVSFLHP